MITIAELSQVDLIRQIRKEAIETHSTGQDCNYIVGCELLAGRKGEAQGKPLEYCNFPYCAKQCPRWMNYEIQERSIEVSL
ncbi:MAG: hypothetical protein NT076_00320 [Candidatus Pacearchaeota archaeon]|nr:hypothetical protein [Candidatus Pacearchaeota archaeon]